MKHNWLIIEPYPEIILNMDQILFKEFALALVPSHFVLQSGTICAKAYRHWMMYDRCRTTINHKSSPLITGELKTRLLVPIE